MDLNKIVQEYKVYQEYSERDKPDLEQLQKNLNQLYEKLSDVPVYLRPFNRAIQKMHESCEISDMIIRAELYDPQGITILEELVDDRNEADEICERMVTPYPIITMNSDSLSKKFHKKYKHRLGELIYPILGDKSARVFSGPHVTGVVLTYEREEKIHRVDFFLVKNFF